MEQIAQPSKEFHLDPFFARQQLVQRTIPLLEPVQIYPYATLLLPGSQNPLAITSTDKIALQPLRQCVLAARTAEPIGHQHQHSIGKREPAGLLHTACFWCQPIQNVLQTQFAPQPARYQHRSPAGGKSRFNALGRTRFRFLAAAQQASTRRMYSSSPPPAPLGLTVRRQIICHDQNEEESADKSRLNLHQKTT